MTDSENAASESFPFVVEMRGIIKRFPGVLANDQVDFYLRQGEIHALLGENGAGKSTLMNILGGLYRPDSGSIFVKGNHVNFNSPRDAIKAGIGMVHQHFMLVTSQTVTENILLGLNHPRFLLRINEYDRIISNMSERYGLKIDPRAKIWQLSVGEQQRVEILKMLYRGADVLIMDEPTAVLAPQEIDGLFKTLKAMIGEGKSIIFISHKLHEVMEIADRITVLRKGIVTAAGEDCTSVTIDELARQMVGREVIFRVDKKQQPPGEVVVNIDQVSAENDKGLPALRDISFQVRAGEIVGLAGVAGNGQLELSQVITGLRKCTGGHIYISDFEMSNRDVRQGIQHGIGYIPEDRTHVGSAPNLSVTDNVIMKKYRSSPIAHGWMVDMGTATKYAEELRKNFEIIVPNVQTPVRLLSGGNLQRVILAREISGKPLFLLAMQPTRGLDVGAIEGVHRLLLEQREAGAAILLISEEIDELLSLSDRLLIIYEGKIMGQVEISPDGKSSESIETIGLMMTGSSLEQIRKA